MCSCSVIIIFFVLLTLLLATTPTTVAEIPGCDYFDTVNLTDTPRYPNASYLYEGHLLIPAELTAEYDHTEQQDGTRVPVKRHMRGCACRLKACLRLCCQLDEILDNGRCELNTEQSPMLEEIGHFLSGYIVQSDLPMPCDDVRPFDLPSEARPLQQNGSFRNVFAKSLPDRRLYCVLPYGVPMGDQVFFDIVPHNCTVAMEDPQKLGKTIVLLLSLVGLFCTICVYLFLEKLQNLPGKCFVCYMISLSIGFLVLLLDLWQISLDFCSTAGYLGYFFVMAAFLWLSVISFSLWNTLCSSRIQAVNHNSTCRFVVCNGFVWGVASLLTGGIYLIDHMAPVNEVWLPGVGQFNCWINVFTWSAMIYFYGPMLVLIGFNVVMFVLTAIRIVAVKRDLRSVQDRQRDRQRDLRSDSQTYSFFLRLFIIYGLPWSLEIVSYLVQDLKTLSDLFLVADYFHWCQGIVIFILFILKPRVLRLCKERYTSCVTTVSKWRKSNGK